MIRRRAFITLLGGAAVSWSLAAARAQQSKILRVGYSGMLPREAPHYAAFEKRMTELGYQQGRNFAFEYIQASSIEGYELTYHELVARFNQFERDLVIRFRRRRLARCPISYGCTCRVALANCALFTV